MTVLRVQLPDGPRKRDLRGLHDADDAKTETPAMLLLAAVLLTGVIALSK